MSNLSVDVASRAAVAPLGAASGEPVKNSVTVTSDGGAGLAAVSPPDNGIISPKGVVDAQSGLYILQFRDRHSGDVIQQYPSAKVVAAYKRSGGQSEPSQAPAQPVATGASTGVHTGIDGAVGSAPVAADAAVPVASSGTANTGTPSSGTPSSGTARSVSQTV